MTTQAYFLLGDRTKTGAFLSAKLIASGTYLRKIFFDVIVDTQGPA
ncbi:hypothetical protein FHW58_004572 [Duganella sp. 1224]|nr:hypothetical protein [Duganella sp. 1224]